MKNYKRILKEGKHIISIPANEEYKLENLFDESLQGSYIEKMNKDGKFSKKEEIVLTNNKFQTSKSYKNLKPFDIIRLTLKRPIEINWTVKFKSNSYIKNKRLSASENYDLEQAQQLIQICNLIYEDKKEIDEKMENNYDNEFEKCDFFTVKSHKKLQKKGYAKLIPTYFKSKSPIVDLQFIHFTYHEPETKKYILNFAFRGSSSLDDWMTNITLEETNIANRGKIHKGFYQSAKLFLKKMKKIDISPKDLKSEHTLKDINYINNNCKIVLTGHSLGGAIATLIGCYLHSKGIKKENITIYTFGAPPIANKKFCDFYEGKFNLFRIVNEKDPIPKIQIISRLQHIGLPIILESDENEMHSCEGYLDNLVDDMNEKKIKVD